MYFELNGVVYPNNSLINISDIGEGDQALLCKTNKAECCGVPPNRFGEFYYPHGVVVPIKNEEQPFFRDRGNQQVRLNRRNQGTSSPTGKYCCEIPDHSNEEQKIFVTLQ